VLFHTILWKTSFINLSHHRLPSSLRTDSTDFTAGPFLLSICFLLLVSSLLFFCLVLCGRLSWLLVSFWAHVNILHRIVSYHICENHHHAGSLKKWVKQAPSQDSRSKQLLNKKHWDSVYLRQGTYYQCRNTDTDPSTKIYWPIANIPWKFHANSFGSFCTKLLTDKQTNNDDYTTSSRRGNKNTCLMVWAFFNSLTKIHIVHTDQHTEWTTMYTLATTKKDIKESLIDISKWSISINYKSSR